MFRQYAEKIPSVEAFPSTPQESLSESVKMLSQVAREAGVWLIGGTSYVYPVTFLLFLTFAPFGLLRSPPPSLPLSLFLPMI
jgi:hydrogenase maturation factor